MVSLKLLDRYILKQLMSYLFLGVLVFTLIAFFSETLLKLMQEVQKYGIPFNTLLTIVGLQLPRSISLVIPASAFLAVLMVYNHMNNQFELIALRMNGISLWRLMMPAVFLGSVCSLTAYAINDYLVPWCSIKTEILKAKAIEETTLPSNGNSFMYRTFDESHNLKQLVYVSHYKGRELDDSTIIDLSKKDLMQIFQSRSGVLDVHHGWELRNVNAYLVSKNKDQSSAGHMDSMKLNDLLSGSEKHAQSNPFEQYEKGVTARSDLQSFMALWQVIQNRHELGKHVSRITYLRLWDKLTWPMSCLVLILSAAPLAITQPRQGSNRGFVYAIMVLFGFYMLYNGFQSFARVADMGGLLPIPVFLALVAWAPIIILALIGIVLTQKKSNRL